MSKLPEVLILGRPNVGKSTLMNRIVGKKKAITLDTPGITRDLSYFPVTWNDKEFFIVDSGGVVFEKNNDLMQNNIDSLVKQAIKRAEKIIFIVENKTGINPLDESIANILRPYKEKIFLIVNKVDPGMKYTDTSEFFSLGLGEPIPVSAAHGTGVSDLLDSLADKLSKKSELKNDYKESYKVAIVGRPNTGKSSLTNALLNEEKVLVSDKAGTTRDSLEFYFKYEDHKYVFIDTAGMRKKARIKDDVEYYSILRANKAFEKADLTLVLLEPDPFLCEQDKRILNMVIESGTNLIVFVNKWDLTKRTDLARRDLMRLAREEMPPLNDYPFIFGSAKERLNLGKIFNTIPDVIAQSEVRVTTAELNKFIEEVIMRTPPPAKKGKRLKIFYATQVEKSPPTFIFFVNEPNLISKPYMRFLEKKMRQTLGKFIGNPIRLFFKARRK
jgi:GTPase